MVQWAAEFFYQAEVRDPTGSDFFLLGRGP